MSLTYVRGADQVQCCYNPWCGKSRSFRESESLLLDYTFILVPVLLCFVSTAISSVSCHYCKFHWR